MRRLLGVVGTVSVMGLAAYMLLAWRSRPLMPHPFFTRQTAAPLVIAHQGGDGLRPSNTMAAFTHAVELGVDVLEMDIHSTADGVLVTIHDATVDRTTNGRGRVQEFTFAELQTLDAGYHWPTVEGHVQLGEHPYRGKGIVIPALEEIFQTFPDTPMVIEIKQREPSIAQPFCDLIRQYDMSNQLLVAAFSKETLQEFRATCPEVITSGAEDEIRIFYILHRLGLSAAYQPAVHAFQVPEYSGDFHVLTPAFVYHTRPHNIDVHAWTINTTADMERMIALSVDGIITDYPDQLLTLLGRGRE